VPAADQLEPEPVSDPVSAVRRAIVIVRYEWLDVRIGGQYASMNGLWPTLLVTAAVVFGCFFVIGRRGSEITSGHEPSSALGASPRAAIPGGLRGGSPIPGSLPSRVVAQAASGSAPAQTAAVGGRSSAAIQARSPAEDASTTLASLPTPAAAVQTAPAEAPVSVTKSPDHSSASVQPSSSRGGSHSSSSGGSFDRSE
jgi:hypothetical protein